MMGTDNLLRFPLGKTSSPVELVLKLNNCACREYCALCHCEFRPETGLWPFVEGGWKPVCAECADAWHPALMRAVRVAK